METVFILHVVVSYFLCGLIWIVQMVHYPAFRYVKEDSFPDFEEFHTRNISLIVVPAMLIELATAVYLKLESASTLLTLNLMLVGLIWLVTFIYSVPCHNALSSGKKNRVIDKLVATNWMRTALWTGKAVIVTYLLVLQST